MYLLTLIIITLCVNAGFFGIVYFTYDQMLEAEKERCQTEYVIMRQRLSGDISQMEQTVPLDEEYFEKYINAYNSYYESDTCLYGVAENTVVGEKKTNKLPKNNGIFIYEEEKTVIYIAQVLDENHKDYRIIMRKTLDDFDETWDTLWPLYIVGGIVLSLGVSFVLAAAVRTILKPMDQLEEAAKQIQEENWSIRVHIKGDNELAQLGRQFNAMAGSVEENIRKREEETRQKQELIDNLAHEMNTPITSIQGFADYMLMGMLSKEEQAESLSFIINESKRLKEISATLLSMADMQENEEIIQEEFSIKDLCDRLEDIFKMQMEEQKICFQVDCQIDKMKGNQALIESLLRNLIINSARAIGNREKGWIKIKIFSIGQQQKILVQDNGCGIQEEHMERIFEPFYRVDKVRSRENGGSGLGLPFCKKIVELHHGTLEVESKVNDGTTFTATFIIS